MQAVFKINVKVFWNKSGDYEIIDSTLESQENENGDSQGDESEEGLF